MTLCRPHRLGAEFGCSSIGGPVGLEILRVVDAPGVTHLRYRVGHRS